MLPSLRFMWIEAEKVPNPTSPFFLNDIHHDGHDVSLWHNLRYDCSKSWLSMEIETHSSPGVGTWRIHLNNDSAWSMTLPSCKTTARTQTRERVWRFPEERALGEGTRRLEDESVQCLEKQAQKALSDGISWAKRSAQDYASTWHFTKICIFSHTESQWCSMWSMLVFQEHTFHKCDSRHHQL